MLNEACVEPEFDADPFFLAFAKAMLGWQTVEHNLFTLFHALLRPKRVESSGAIYYSLNSFGAKLSIADKTAVVALDGELLKRWNKLKKALDVAARDRNAMAHLTAAADFENGSLALVPPLFVPGQLIQRRNKKYDVKTLEAIARTFRELAGDLETLTNRLAGED